MLYATRCQHHSGNKVNVHSLHFAAPKAGIAGQTDPHLQYLSWFHGFLNTMIQGVPLSLKPLYFM